VTRFLRFLFGFLFEAFATCGAGKGDASKGRPVIAPPASAAGGDDGGEGGDDDPAGSEGDEGGGEADPKPKKKKKKKAESEEPDELEADEDEEEDDEEDDADEEEDEDEDEDEEDDDADEDEEEDEDDDDSPSAMLASSWKGRLASDATRDPTGDVFLDFTKAKITPEARAALKKKLVPANPDADQIHDAEAILDVAEEIGVNVAKALLNEYHQKAGWPTQARVTIAERKASVKERLGALEKRYGAKLTDAVQTHMRETWTALKDEFGAARADLVPYEDLYRMVPKKIRKAAATKPGKGKGGSGPEERASRRERAEALRADDSPRGLVRTSPRGGRRRELSRDEKDRAAVATTIARAGAPLF
jgi:hypothetical protein